MFSVAVRRAIAFQRVQPNACTRRVFVHVEHRHIQTAAAGAGPAEAYLEEAKPGIHYLSLNRPKAKNAISRRLLVVSIAHTI